MASAQLSDKFCIYCKRPRRFYHQWEHVCTHTKCWQAEIEKMEKKITEKREDDQKRRDNDQKKREDNQKKRDNALERDKLLYEDREKQRIHEENQRIHEVKMAENRSEENEANRSHEIALKEKETERLVEERKLIEAKIRLLEMGIKFSLPNEGDHNTRDDVEIMLQELRF